ncbi:Forkhead box protein B1 [Halotydeus destructor]|nr:Forkhead box protein B1 [Halotydeus destructor]
MCDSNNEADHVSVDSSSPLSLRMKQSSNPSNELQAIEGNVNSQAGFAFASSSMGLAGQVNQSALIEYQRRLQLFDYAAQAAAIRFRLSQAAMAGNAAAAAAAAASASGGNHPYGHLGGHPALTDGSPYGGMSPFGRYDPRYRFLHEEPKPQHSYIGLIAMAILSAQEKKMVLSDIYQHILDHYPYFRNRGPGWRNSIRHNLSLNDCFIKSGRSANGKGHYWAIHPANIDDFQKGDFRRRKAQRKVRKHMGLSVPEDEDSQSPSSTPTPRPMMAFDQMGPGPLQLSIPTAPQLCANLASLQAMCLPFAQFTNQVKAAEQMFPITCPREPTTSFSGVRFPTSKRQFDVESLLAPDCDD